MTTNNNTANLANAITANAAELAAIQAAAESHGYAVPDGADYIPGNGNSPAGVVYYYTGTDTWGDTVSWESFVSVGDGWPWEAAAIAPFVARCRAASRWVPGTL